MENFTSAGARLKYIRTEILKFPPKVLRVKYGLSPFQVYSWENGRLKVTQKVLDTYKKVFVAEGILVRDEWILEGAGLAPSKALPVNVMYKLIDSLETEFSVGTISEDILIQKELQSFLNYHNNAICVQVESDAMLPFYFKGDYVCGVLISSQAEMAKLLGFDCIVKLENGSILVRRLSKINEEGSFNLSCHSPIPGVNDPAIFNVQVQSVARIILHRTKTSKDSE